MRWQDWVASMLLWLVPVAAFNALMLTWRWRMTVRGPGFNGEIFMRHYVWAVVNAGLACLVVGFATSPVHPGDSLFTGLGALVMPVLLLGYLGMNLAREVVVDTRERWTKEDREAGRKP